MMASVLVACGGGNKGGEATPDDTPKGDTPAAETLESRTALNCWFGPLIRLVDLTKEALRGL